MPAARYYLQISGYKKGQDGKTIPDTKDWTVILPYPCNLMDVGEEVRMKAEALDFQAGTWSLTHLQLLGVCEQTALVVHGLQSGKPLCEFLEEIPKNWPEGHRFVPASEVVRITCNGCKPKAVKLFEKEADRAKGGVRFDASKRSSRPDHYGLPY